MSLRFVSTLAACMLLSSAVVAEAKDCRLTVYFGLDRSDLTPEMQQVLYSFISHNPRAHGTVVGHTDALGSQDYNMALSMRRSLMVANFIEQYNARSVDLATDWRGKTNLVVNSSGAEALNRRVEIYYHNCTPPSVAPVPSELHHYISYDDDDHEHEEHEHDDGGSSSANAGNGGTSASSSGSEGSAAASANENGTSASSSGHDGAAAASAGNGQSSASSTGSGFAASASAGPNGASASSAGHGGASAASAGGGSTSVSSTGD